MFSAQGHTVPKRRILYTIPRSVSRAPRKIAQRIGRTRCPTRLRTRGTRAPAIATVSGVSREQIRLLIEKAAYAILTPDTHEPETAARLFKPYADKSKWLVLAA